MYKVFWYTGKRFYSKWFESLYLARVFALSKLKRYPETYLYSYCDSDVKLLSIDVEVIPYA